MTFYTLIRLLSLNLTVHINENAGKHFVEESKPNVDKLQITNYVLVNENIHDLQFTNSRYFK